MKKIFSSILFLILFSRIGSAQYEPAYGTTKAEPKSLKACYLGLGTGIYGKYGFLGLDFGVRLSPKTLAEVNLGIGGWGSKAGFSFTTFAGASNTWCPSIGFTRNSGAALPSMDSKVNLPNSNEEVTVTSDMIYNPVNIIHLSVQKQFVSTKGNRFFIELGYSLAINEVKVEFDQPTLVYKGTTYNTSDLKFSNVQTAAHKAQAPNGINISLGYQFGLGKYN
ncbi:MAG: hypothetical protein CFE21_06375 [Bacteroidetes bacterium B1(2017)]|nr:MAG: hypothetical protein CFE21_06375 [Bacteroidetes bacterium B1(2017)]